MVCISCEDRHGGVNFIKFPSKFWNDRSSIKEKQSKGCTNYLSSHRRDLIRQVDRVHEQNVFGDMITHAVA